MYMLRSLASITITTTLTTRNGSEKQPFFFYFTNKSSFFYSDVTIPFTSSHKSGLRINR